MRVQHQALLRSVAGAMGFGVIACGGPATTSDGLAKATDTLCVTVEDGANFVVEDGRLRPISTTRPDVATPVVNAPIGWAAKLESTFADRGFPWMGLLTRGGVATLTGVAPDQDAKERAFLAGEQAILTHSTGRREIAIVADGIAVDGGEQGVGAGLAKLSQSNLSVESCQTAFTETMQGRNVEFRTSSAVIRADSGRLLDAVTGVAILCRDYPVIVEGHTDARGSDDINMELSEMRAKSVREYMVGRGVSSDGVEAVGYGETRPINPDTTREAYIINRRMEFKVLER